MTKPTYFFSDMHVSGSEPRSARLIELLSSLEGKAEAVYFVGDSFDFWLGYRSVIFSAYFDFLSAIARLMASGVKVTFLSGNHDPGLGRFLVNLGAAVHTSPLSIQVGEHRLYLDHGDTIDPRGCHRRLVCRLARNRLLMGLARMVHPDIAWRLSRWYARKPHTYLSPLPPRLLSEYFPRCIEAGHNVVVIGHYHRAVVHQAQNSQFFALGDWVQQFTYLECAEGTFRLLRHRPGQSPLELEKGDHGPL